MQLTHEDVSMILKLLDESPYDELKIETEGFSLTLKCKSDMRRLRQPKRSGRREKITGTRHG